MREHEEIEEVQNEFEECGHSFHEEEEPHEDMLEQMVKMEGAISVITNMLEDEEEEREELLKRQARFNAERCPRCGRPHHQKAAKS